MSKDVFDDLVPRKFSIHSNVKQCAENGCGACNKELGYRIGLQEASGLKHLPQVCWCGEDHTIHTGA